MTGTIKVSPEKLTATAGEFSTEGSNMSSLVSDMIKNESVGVNMALRHHTRR